MIDNDIMIDNNDEYYNNDNDDDDLPYYIPALLRPANYVNE